MIMSFFCFEGRWAHQRGWEKNEGTKEQADSGRWADRDSGWLNENESEYYVILM